MVRAENAKHLLEQADERFRYAKTKIYHKVTTPFDFVRAGIDSAFRLPQDDG